MRDLFDIELHYKNIRLAYDRGFLTATEVLHISEYLEETREACENEENG